MVSAPAPATAATPALAGAETADTAAADGASPHDAETLADVDGPAVAPARPASRRTINIPKSNKKGKNAASGPTLDDLRAVMADAPTEATHDAPDAKFASERVQKALADLRSRPRWVATETAFDAVRHLRSPEEEGGGRNSNTNTVPIPPPGGASAPLRPCPPSRGRWLVAAS